MSDVKTSHPAERPMRRKDRQIADRAEIHAILAAEPVMHLAMTDGDWPFVVPVFFAHDGDAIYFHSAPAGAKIDLLRRNPNVCFEVTSGYTIIGAEAACDFSASYRSVVGFGRAVFLDDAAEMTAALDRILARFSERSFTYPPAMIAKTAVLRIDIDRITGKARGA